jgi:hypothetical protein
MAGTRWKRISPDGGLCASLNKYGEPCGCREVRISKRSGKPRCKYHGGNGKQTGPKTKAGKLMAFANLTGPKSKAGRAKANRNLTLGRLTKAQRIERAREIEARTLRGWVESFRQGGRKHLDYFRG